MKINYADENFAIYCPRYLAFSQNEKMHLTSNVWNDWKTVQEHVTCMIVSKVTKSNKNNINVLLKLLFKYQ